MGIAIPQVLSEDKASGAQIVDGSLRFDTSKDQYLIRTPSSTGNRKTFTFSAWFKRGTQPSEARVFNAASATDGGGSNPRTEIGFGSGDLRFHLNSSGSSWSNFDTSSLFRDSSAWYHIMWVLDTTQSTGTNQRKIYVNGILQTALDNSGAVTQNQDTPFNTANYPHILGGYGNVPTENNYDGLMSQVYLIDGQALDPSYFGYTDPLTNTWRPKKLSSSVAFGTNGFYLPFDGSAPIGQDQSGRGNNWTPVNFGGSNTLEKATGALPILNTDGGGKVARVGVRTDSSASSLVLALPLVGIKSDFSNAINSGTSNKIVTVTNAVGVSTQSNFYGGSYLLGNGKYLDVAGISIAENEDYTIEFWVKLVSASSYATIHPGSGYWGNLEFYWSIQNVNSSDGQSVLNKWRVEDGAGGMDSNNVKTDYDESASVATSWNHISFVRSSGNCYLYYNGRRQTLHGATTDTSAKSGTLRIGHTSNGEYYLSDYRFYKGTAKYTQNFIPASTDPDILPDTPSGVAYSSNVALVPSTDGAVAFDGNGDYLSIPDSADLDLGNSNFTIEGFVYVNSTSGSQQTFVAKGTGANNQASYHIALNTSGNWVYYLSSNGSTWDIVSAAVIGTYTPNAWQHITLVRSGNTFTPYLNGVAGTPTTSSATLFDSNKILSIGADDPGGQLLFGFISNAHIVKGTALYTSNFTPPSAPISSVANTKLLCCKSNSSATAFDVSPGTITANGNAAATNFNPFTVNINTQRGKQSGYATLNPLDKGSEVTLANGNLNVTWTNVSGHSVRATTSISTGKWYWEVVTGANASIGIIKSDLGIVPSSGALWPGANGFGSGGSYAYSPDGNKVTNSSYSSYGTAFTNGDIVGVAFDAINGSIYFSYNGIWQGNGNPSTGTNPAYSGISTSASWGPAIGYWTAPGSNVNALNFGQKPFKFPPPAGFQPLALANTPRPSIVRPDQYVGVTTYTGTGAASRPVTNLGFKPDFVWIKNRSSGSYSHQLFDSVRGASAGCLYSDLTNAQDSNFPITSFDTSGFTLGSSASLASQSYASQNGSGSNYVGWAWKAGGNSNTYNINDVGYATASAAGLTAGTITPTGASVNTKSGFSIIGYTGNGSGSQTVAHGLSKSPSFIIIKQRIAGPGTDLYNWNCYHSALGATKFISLNTTDAASTAPLFSDTAPTSTVFTLGSTSGTYNNVNNANNVTYIAYAWAEIPGFSKFGSYVGGGSNYPYINTGFAPAWVMIKDTSTGGTNYDWHIFDSERNPYNLGADNADSKNVLFANLNSAENKASSPWAQCDFLSNGFRVNDQSVTLNNSGSTYIFATFAETPSFNLYGGQSNAR